MNELEKLQMEVEKLRSMLDFLIRSDRYYFQNDIDMADGINIRASGLVGTKIGLNTTDKIAFHGSTPVIQASAISAPSGQANDLDSEARTAIDLIRTVLTNKGFTA